MIRLSRITKIFSETVLIQKTSSVPSMMRKLSTNTYLSAPSDCILPEPPLPPNEVVLNTLGEPTLASLGLNSYWPSGWYQSLLETLHVHLDLPWWGAIAASTILIRMCMFPVMVRQRRHLAEYTNIIPQVTVLQESLTRARLSGNYVEMMRTSEKMSQLMKNNNLNPLNTFKYVFLQAPIFLGVFTGIRGLVNLPVTSLQTGGTACLRKLNEHVWCFDNQPIKRFEFLHDAVSMITTFPLLNLPVMEKLWEILECSSRCYKIL
ncbi:putative cytochrome oxidase biogenesis protein (oxa1 mitochondrial) [Schistosoma mansoni]|uniref:putative cytochrome oxidase biogenesis protein (oxa1 mitochondrial) n=1 Tax=Schistosoma mansoni TaxID=6183 RepID=UPI00022DC8E3|nr:putative cytochrome oxidase biogenesis protein (oxa1 mitochondrial) [Schistosoma mansoni]|eukprot:XP_018647739.1 putative cytochrome oxidase biogenesis protein (oxa1 mitochondrial) [Schistosoma mansoni]